MGRRRKLDKKVTHSITISPLTLRELDEFCKDSSRSALVEVAIINEIHRRRGIC